MIVLSEISERTTNLEIWHYDRNLVVGINPNTKSDLTILSQPITCRSIDHAMSDVHIQFNLGSDHIYNIKLSNIAIFNPFLTFQIF